MHFFTLMQQLSEHQKVDIYVDMDGVLASYDVYQAIDFLHKRPLYTNIHTIQKLCELSNVNLYILSICRLDIQIQEKNEWLDQYAPFFDREKRVIISKESHPNVTSKELKFNYLKNLNSNHQKVLIDDDNEIVYTIHNQLKDVIVYQDSELID